MQEAIKENIEMESCNSFSSLNDVMDDEETQTLREVCGVHDSQLLSYIISDIQWVFFY